MVQPTAVLLLQDGTICYGTAFGAIGTTTGEICFNTGMTGYQEVFTDPSYYGQVLIMNSVHIGNYGVKDDEVESANVKIKGLIAGISKNSIPANSRKAHWKITLLQIKSSLLPTSIQGRLWHISAPRGR